jgi:hypothetical protein
MSASDGRPVNVLHVVAPTLAVIATWLIVATILAGCGFLTRRLLLRWFSRSGAEGLSAADLWLGLAVLLAYLELWSLVFRIGWFAWLAPIAFGAAGLVLGVRRLERIPPRRLSIPALVLAATAILWAANQALGQALDYDLGLYHLNAIDYALKYAAIPGLGNLHDRLGAGNAHLLFVAFLQHGPWSRTGYHLANGLLLSMLVVDVASRFAVRPETARASSFSRRMALMLGPAALATAGASTAYRLASPNLDLAAFVLVAIGALYLAEAVERGLDPSAAVVSTAAFSMAGATRPLCWIPALLAVIVLVLAARPSARSTVGGYGRTFLLVAMLPGALVLGWLGRQAVLSGYPLFPLTLGGLPVDWRMPATTVHALSSLVTSWSRVPGDAPNQVGSFSHWFPGWFHAQTRSYDVVVPFTLLVCALPALSCRSPEEIRERSARVRPMLAVLIALLPMLVVWFLVSPDPRFALAPFWLVPIAVIAWALPTADRRHPLVAGVLTVVCWYALVRLGQRDIRWLFLAAFDAFAIATVVMRVAAPRVGRSLLAYVAVTAVLFAPLGIIWYGGAYDVVTANAKGGQLGIPPQAGSLTAPFVTTSGLRLVYPTPPADEDRCFDALLCTPQTNAALRLRGSSVADGFTYQPPPAAK